jgi:hypothetical protein
MKNAGWKPALRNGARTMGTRRSPPLKTKSPDWSRSARKPAGLLPCSNKKSVLGEAGTHFRTALIVPGSYCTCQGER